MPTNRLRRSVSEETVKGRVKNILSKLGANDRTHAVAMAMKRYALIEWFGK
jgi:DNA-binding NarL/FixJ family response regulator